MSEDNSIVEERRSYIPFGLVIGFIVGAIAGMITNSIEVSVPVATVLGGLIGLRIGKNKSPKSNVLVDAYKERKKEKSE